MAATNKSKAKKAALAQGPSVPQGPKEEFYRIVEHDLPAGDTYRGYQPERIVVQGGRVISRELVEKPNLFEYAQTQVIDLIDPRNHVKPVKSSELA